MSATGIDPRVVFIALWVNLIANFVRLLFHEDYYDHIGYPYVAIVCGTLGLLVSIFTLIYSLRLLKGGWRVTVVIGSLLTGYWWSNDIAWWVMSK